MQLVPEPRKMAINIARRWRGTWEGVPMATWCSEWICRIGEGLVHHIVIILTALSLLPLRGVAVGCAQTILPIDWFCTRFSSFVILQFFRMLVLFLVYSVFLAQSYSREIFSKPQKFWWSELAFGRVFCHRRLSQITWFWTYLIPAAVPVLKGRVND